MIVRASKGLEMIQVGGVGVIAPKRATPEREFITDNLLVRIHFIIVMNKWTSLAPWNFEISCSGSLTSTFLVSGAMS